MRKKNDGFRVDLKFNAGLDENGQPFFVVDATNDEVESAKALIESAGKAMEGVRAAGYPAVQTDQVLRGSMPAGPAVGSALAAFRERDDLKPTTKRRYAPMLDHLANFLGDATPLANVTQSRFAEYAAQTRADERLAPKTKNMYITTAGTFFGWCVSRYDQAPQITASKLKIKRLTPTRDERAAFTIDELRSICREASKFRSTEPHKFWITVLLTFTGMRVEELAQLDINTDLKKDEDSGYWYFEIHGRDGNSVKSQAGWRNVPIHPAVVDAGFLSYVTQQRQAGATRLFPQWRPRVDPKHGGTIYGHEAVKWGRRQIEKLRLTRVVKTPKVTYFHSMRHALINNLKQALVEESLRAAIVGHEAGGINNQRYGKQYHIGILGDALVTALPQYGTLLTPCPPDQAR